MDYRKGVQRKGVSSKVKSAFEVKGILIVMKGLRNSEKLLTFKKRSGILNIYYKGKEGFICHTASAICFLIQAQTLRLAV